MQDRAAGGQRPHVKMNPVFFYKEKIKFQSLRMDQLC